MYITLSVAFASSYKREQKKYRRKEKYREKKDDGKKSALGFVKILHMIADRQ